MPQTSRRRESWRWRKAVLVLMGWLKHCCCCCRNPRTQCGRVLPVCQQHLSLHHLSLWDLWLCSLQNSPPFPLWLANLWHKKTAGPLRTWLVCLTHTKLLSMSNSASAVQQLIFLVVREGQASSSNPPEIVCTTEISSTRDFFLSSTFMGCQPPSSVNRISVVLDLSASISVNNLKDNSQESLFLVAIVPTVVRPGASTEKSLLPINEEIIKIAGFVTHRANPCGFLFIHLEEHRGVKTLQVVAGGGPAWGAHSDFAQLQAKEKSKDCDTTSLRRRLLSSEQTMTVPQWLLWKPYSPDTWEKPVNWL